MLRQGLTLLSSVIKNNNHEELVELVKRSIVSVRRDHRDSIWGDWIANVVEYTHQERRREDWFSEEDAAQDRGDKTPFCTDTPYQPPLAWVTLWKGEASNLFGSFVPATWRRWGYVMWDAPRLETSGAMKWYMEVEDRMARGDPRELYREDSGS
jgi:hypothetical protein